MGGLFSSPPPSGGPQGPSALLVLPDEVVMHMLEFLPPEDLLAMSAVSRRWWNLVQDDVLWRKAVPAALAAAADPRAAFVNWNNGTVRQHYYKEELGEARRAELRDGMRNNERKKMLRITFGGPAGTGTSQVANRITTGGYEELSSRVRFRIGAEFELTYADIGNDTHVVSWWDSFNASRERATPQTWARSWALLPVVVVDLTNKNRSWSILSDHLIALGELATVDRPRVFVLGTMLDAFDEEEGGRERIDTEFRRHVDTVLDALDALSLRGDATKPEVSVFTVSAKTNDGIEQFRNAAIEACYRIMYCTSDEVNARARFSGRR